MTRKIQVELPGGGYTIFIRSGLLKEAGAMVRTAVPSRKVAVLSSEKILKTHGRVLFKSLRQAGIQARPILVQDGESHKNERSLFYILKKLAQLGFQRDSGLIAFGGGVVGDLGGLAASLYMRGITFVQCPTTLLAQVDASVGGKTAIDFGGIKNLVGSFYQPNRVLIDPSVLETLDDRNYRTGLAEVVKYGVIRDAELFERLEANVDGILAKDKELLSRLITGSCRIKAEIVSRDEKENGRRAWLNYGHTLGHAMESYYGYRRLTHGEAITYGMWFASMLSVRSGLCGEEVVRRQLGLFRRLGLLRKVPKFDSRVLLQKMLLDKKARGGKVLFVLTRKIGLVTIQKSTAPSLINSTLTQFQAEISELP